MSSIAHNQLTLNFEPSLPDDHPTLRAFITHRVQVQKKPAKTIAGDMDMSPSTLSRKLTPGDGDTQRFTVDDLENYITVTKDTTPIEYLAAKYLSSDEQRQARAISRVEALALELERTLASLRVKA